VFEFCATDYELPARFERRVVEAAPPWPGGAPRRIEFWSVEGPCAYAMVAEPAEEKHRRSEARPSEGQPGSPDRPAASEPGPHEKQARNPAITRAAVPQF
jgi:hypothetical protein